MTPRRDSDDWIVAVDPDWPGFAGHFPGDPILPAAELIEIARQCAGIEGPYVVVKARFVRAVQPGDDLRLSCVARDGLHLVTASVDGERAADMRLRSHQRP